VILVARTHHTWEPNAESGVLADIFRIAKQVQIGQSWIRSLWWMPLLSAHQLPVDCRQLHDPCELSCCML